MMVLREESIVCWLVNREEEEATAAIGWLADGERTRIEPTPQEEYARRGGT